MKYRRLNDDWKYICRADDCNKVISEKARLILAQALYRIKKYNIAILTHKTITEITGKKVDQNRRLIKQLGLVFDIEFSRCLFVENVKYNDVYKLILTEKGEEILENPKEYFEKFYPKIDKKVAAKIDKKAEIDLSKKSSTSQQNNQKISAKNPLSQETLNIYIKKLIIKEIYKINRKLDLDIFVPMSAVNFKLEFEEKYQQQEEEFYRLIKNNCTFDFNDKDFSFGSLHQWLVEENGADATNVYQTEFQKLANAVNEQWYQSCKKKEAAC